jgi:hypothetical protein
VAKALSRFEAAASGRQTDQRAGPRLSPGQQYALRHLGLLVRQEENEDRRAYLANVERALRARIPDAAVRELNRLRRLALPTDLMRERLELLYRDLDLGRYIRHAEEVPPAPVARVVCSEALVADGAANPRRSQRT